VTVISSEDPCAPDSFFSLEQRTRNMIIGCFVIRLPETHSLTTDDVEAEKEKFMNKCGGGFVQCFVVWELQKKMCVLRS